MRASERYEAIEEALGSVADPDQDWGSNGTMVLAAWVYEMDICIHLEGVPEVTLRCRAKNKPGKTRHVLYNGYHFDPYEAQACDSGVGEGMSSGLEPGESQTADRDGKREEYPQNLG